MPDKAPPKNNTKKKPAPRANTKKPVTGPGRDEQVEIRITAPTPPDAPRYPAGMRIKLTRQEIDGLGLPADTYEVLGG